MNYKENILNKSVQKLLMSVLPLGSNSLTKLEQIILKEVLLNNKTFEELIPLTGVTAERQRTIFINATNRLCKTLRIVNKEVFLTKENLK
ncbi:MAG: hypothetical protein HYX39_06235 [Bacteroidetes bacterium]|nr:hypothetical protein [Bacteroidota bacterium]